MAESIARAGQNDPRLTEEYPEGYLPLIAVARLARGAVGGAAEALKSAIEACSRAHDSFGVIYPRMWTEFWVVSDGAIPPPPDVAASDTSARALVTRGLVAVARGDRAVARRIFDALQKRPRRDLAQDRIAMLLLEARLEAMAGRPEEAVRLLRPFATPLIRQTVSLTWAHWWLADAFEQLGRPDSAATYLERLEPVAFTFHDSGERSYVHRRLALLYAKLGRMADADRHLAATEKIWDRPDPEVRRMLDEARAAVASARGMARPGTERPAFVRPGRPPGSR